MKKKSHEKSNDKVCMLYDMMAATNRQKEYVEAHSVFTLACPYIKKNCFFIKISMFWFICKVKHLLSLNETGVLHHLACCAHKHREAGCDSKSKQAVE